MLSIQLLPLTHRGALQIAIKFPYQQEIKDYIKQLEGVKWSQTHRSFYLNYSFENKNLLFAHLREKGWYVDYSALQTVKPAPEVSVFRRKELGALSVKCQINFSF